MLSFLVLLLLPPEIYLFNNNEINISTDKSNYPTYINFFTRQVNNDNSWFSHIESTITNICIFSKDFIISASPHKE